MLPEDMLKIPVKDRFQQSYRTHSIHLTCDYKQALKSKPDIVVIFVGNMDACVDAWSDEINEATQRGYDKIV